MIILGVFLYPDWRWIGVVACLVIWKLIHARQLRKSPIPEAVAWQSLPLMAAVLVAFTIIDGNPGSPENFDPRMKTWYEFAASKKLRSELDIRRLKALYDSLENVSLTPQERDEVVKKIEKIYSLY